MNAVTCQVSAYRYTLTPARAAAGPGLPSAAGTTPSSAGTGRAVRYLSSGSHSSTASAAGAAHTPSASRTEPPELRYSGTLSSEDRIAPMDSVVR